MSTAIVPIPRCEISIRVATSADLPFVDRLQDMHTKMVEYFQRAALEQKIGAGHVLIAEDEMRLPVGYVIAQDRYFKRDDVGIVYQLNVSPGMQRKLVGVALLKAVFERAAYGCKLFCCWCAQDLEANYFWESLGFIPLAFRTGAAGKKGARTHIFWQRRIREGDVTTPYWFPAKTDGGSMREDRLVLPIPPGVSWKDAMPVLLPQGSPKQIENPKPETQQAKAPVPVTPMPRKRQRVQFGPPSANTPVEHVEVVQVTMGKPKRAKKVKPKTDPGHVAKARELRDRYLEQFNSGQLVANAKYEVSKAVLSQPHPHPLLLAQKAA